MGVTVGLIINPTLYGDANICQRSVNHVKEDIVTLPLKYKTVF